MRVTRNHPCPICGKPDWCLIAPDKRACICMRIEAGSIRRTKNGGFIHHLNAPEPKAARRRRRGVKVTSWRQLDALRYRELLPQYRTAVNPARLDKLAATLGVSVASLNRLGIGWAYDWGTWSFPMTNATGTVTGFRLRSDTGRKWAVPGSREGLFIPDDLPDGVPLLITEGPTDCAALLDMGFAAVGRPSCTGGVSLLAALVKRRKPPEVVIVADADTPGQRGAGSLASVLRVHCPAVRIVCPPEGIKDVRAWKRAGAVAADVQQVIDAAPILSLSMKTNRNGGKG